jgi:cytochrome bd-type quinol oxidase subunit 2
MNTPTDLPSPYQSPTADLSQPVAPPEELPPHQRSAAPKVFGVLSIIFSSVVLLGSALGLLGTVASSALEGMGNMVNDADKAAEINAMIGPMARVYRGLGLESLILFLMSALLLAIGIGQLRYRAWARRWSVYWAVAALACVVLLVVISMVIVSPAYADLLDALSRIKPPNGEAPMPQMGALSGMVGGVFAVIAIIFYTPYPALMLLFFTREHVRASMTR